MSPPVSGAFPQRAKGVAAPFAVVKTVSAFCAPDQALASGYDGTYVMNFAGLASNQVRPAAAAIAQAVQDALGER